MSDNPSQYQILADAKILKCNIKSAILRDDKNTTMVAYGKPEQPAPKVSFTELSGQFAEMIDIKDLKFPGQLNNIQCSLRQVYFKKVTPIGDGDDSNKQVSDYALWLDLHAESLTKGWPIEVDKISIKVWSTKNEKILDDMEITEMKTLLDS